MGAALNNENRTSSLEIGYSGGSLVNSIFNFIGTTEADWEALEITSLASWLHVDWIERGLSPYGSVGLVFIVSADYRFDPHGPYYRSGDVIVTDGENTWTYTYNQRQYPDAYRADTYPFCTDAIITFEEGLTVPPGGMTVTASIDYDAAHCIAYPSYTISAIPPYYPGCGEEHFKQFVGSNSFYADFYTHRVWMVWAYVKDIYGYYRASGYCILDQQAEVLPSTLTFEPDEEIVIPADSGNENPGSVIDLIVKTNSPYTPWHLYNGLFHTACYDDGHSVNAIFSLTSGDYAEIFPGAGCGFLRLDGQGTQTVRINVRENTTTEDVYYYLFFGNIAGPDDPLFVQCALVVIHQLPAEPPPPPEDHPGGVTLVSQRRGYYIAYVDIGQPLRMERYSSSDSLVESVFTIDADTQVTEPRLAAHPYTGVLSIVYRKSDGWYRKVSWDRGATWVSDPLEGGPFRQVAHLREIFNPRTGERLDFYTDANGLLQVDIFDAAERFVGTFPEGMSGIFGGSVGNASFEALFLGDDRSSEIHIVFYVDDTWRRFRSVDGGRSWADLAPP